MEFKEKIHDIPYFDKSPVHDEDWKTKLLRTSAWLLIYKYKPIIH